jgi:hypothetical protein
LAVESPFPNKFTVVLIGEQTAIICQIPLFKRRKIVNPKNHQSVTNKQTNRLKVTTEKRKKRKT